MKIYRPAVAAAGAALLAAISLSACSSSSDSEATQETAAAEETVTEDAAAGDTEVVEEAQEEVVAEDTAGGIDVEAEFAKWYATPQWEPPASAPPPAQDKLVFDIPCTQAAAGCARPGDAFLEAADALGWKTQMIDPQGDPVKLQAAIKQAVQAGADGIYIAGGTVQQIGKDLMKEVKDAGVVMIAHGGDDQPLGGEDGWDALVNNDYGQTAPILALYVANDSAGQAKVIAVNDSEYPEVNNGFVAFKETLGEVCDTCEIVDEMDFSIVDIATTMPQRLKALLQANPDVNYVYSPYDFASTIMAEAIDQLGLSGQVKLIGADGNPQNLQLIEEGKQAASIARPYEILGYVAADQMNRIFNGEEPLVDERGFHTQNYPLQLVDKSNLPADTATPYNLGIDYQSIYKNLWGVE